MKFGSSNVFSFRLGSATPSKIYLGAVEIWSDFVAVAPGEVQNATAVSSATEQGAADLEWEAPLVGTGPFTYNIYWSTNGGTTYTLLESNVSTTTFTAISPIAGLGAKQVSFDISAVNEVGEGPGLGGYKPNVTLSDSVPEPPQNLTATQDIDGELDLVWDLSGNNGHAGGVTAHTVEWDYEDNTWGNSFTSGSFNTATITDADIGELIYIRVRATNAVGDSEWSATITATPADVPAQITDLQVDYDPNWTVGDSDLVAFFYPPDNNGSEITGYTIEWSLDQNMGEILGSDTWQDNSVSIYRALYAEFIGGYTYYFRANATNALGNGPLSEIANAVAPDTVPLAPTDVTFEPNYGTNDGNVNWTAPHDGGDSITSYDVEHEDINTLSSTVVNTNTATPGYNFSITAGEEKRVRVRAVNSIGAGPWSSWTSAIYFTDDPGDPTNFSATDEDLGEVLLDWDAPSNANLLGPNYYYKIEYSSDSFSNFTTIDNISSASTSYLLTGLTPGVSYDFRVYTVVPGRDAFNGDTLSGYASTNITPAAGVPSAPTVTAATWDETTDTLAISYTAPADNGSAIIEYYVYFDGVYAYSAADPASIVDATNRIGANVTISAVNAVGEGLQSDPAIEVADANPSRTLYFNGAVDTYWDTLGNWFDDVDFITPAASLPTAIDSVIVSAPIANNSGTEPTVANITLNDPNNIYPYLGINLTVTGVATFNDLTNNSGILTGSALFNNGAYNGGTVTGNAEFTGALYGAYNANSATVNGNALFSGLSYNSGTVDGDATFNDDTYNFGSVGGTATFNDDACTSVLGTAMTFVPSPPPYCAAAMYFTGSSNSDWSTLANWVVEPNIPVASPLLPRSIDSVTIQANVSSNSGSAPTVNEIVVGDGVVFSGMTLTATNGAIFNNGATLGFDGTGTIVGNVAFDGSAKNRGTVDGNATFNQCSYNDTDGDVMGDATFNGSSYNHGAVTGTATFNDAACNSSGTAGTFVPDPAPDCAAATTLYFTGATSGDWNVLSNWARSWDSGGSLCPAFNLPTANDNVVVMNNTSITSNSGSNPTIANLTLNEASIGASVSITVTGVATFNTSSINYGTIDGDAVFTSSSYNNGTVTGDATFSGTGFNDGGDVTGTATFTDSGCTYSGTFGATSPDPPPSC